MSRFLCLILLFTVYSVAADARMYQWLDPDTKITQLSGKPPSWYRSDTPGPRVIVFDNGKVIDDTSIQVSDQERVRLRSDALAVVAADREKERQKLLEQEAMKAQQEAMRKAEADSKAQNAPQAAAAENKPEKTAEPVAKNEEDTVEKMKALIDTWEKQQSEKARETLGADPNSLPK